MEKTILLIRSEFISSSQSTPQWNEFARTFKREFKKLLHSYIKDFSFSKGHFEVSGFFQLKDDRIYYYSIDDVRGNHLSCANINMLLRTAKSFKDYTGGGNGFIPFDNNLLEGIKRQARI